MRFWLIAAGRLRQGPLLDLFQDYAGRLNGGLNLREIEVKRRVSGPELKRLEAEELLAAAPPAAAIVALDERGQSLTSPAFAQRIGGWRDSGVADLAFIIGGADGLDDMVRGRAALVLGLGAMTWPHMLARVMLAEQLYRAQAILAGHPYHRE